MTGASSPAYDCLTCGVCCAPESPSGGYVRLTDLDLVRLRSTDVPVLTLAVQDADPPEVLFALGTKADPNGRRVCAALSGCAGGENACRIYEQRPTACRRFEVGGYFCVEARRRFGLPVG